MTLVHIPSHAAGSTHRIRRTRGPIHLFFCIFYHHPQAKNKPLGQRGLNLRQKFLVCY